MNLMKTVLVLITCLGLSSIAGAAQNNNNQQQVKRKGGTTASVVTRQPSKTINATGTGTTLPSQKFQHLNTTGGNQFKANKFQNQSSLNTSASKTTFNKTKNVNINKNLTVNKNLNVNKNLTVNKNFKVQKFNLANKPNGKYQAVKFNQNFKFAGAQNWKGSKYAFFKNYHPQWQNQWWWSHHYNHISIVFGAPYYWDNGYWCPAWGYDPSASYYFDGPIYASNPDMDPGQVVANVQSALQQQGFYQGDIDGVLGPQTRAALAEYQSAQGIEPTGAIDEPTLQTLGMA